MFECQLIDVTAALHAEGDVSDTDTTGRKQPSRPMTPDPVPTPTPPSLQCRSGQCRSRLSASLCNSHEGIQILDLRGKESMREFSNALLHKAIWYKPETHLSN
ncbi:hypothetical protein J6590_030466 [Homalodisca vitripennis]|nr:hypothetical protein J6590_030466 [Homalodisca vitripennis]